MRRKEYLIQRGERYTFRMKVPIHLRPLLGRIEIRRALGTTDLSKARMHAQRMAWVTLRAFKAMDTNKINLTSQQISDHLDSWYDQMLERDLEIGKLAEAGLWEMSKAEYQESLDHIPFHLTDLLEAIVDPGREPDRPDWDQPKVPSEKEREEALRQAESFMEWMGEDSDTVPVLRDPLPSLGELEEAHRRELLIAFLRKAVKAYNAKERQQSGVNSGTTRISLQPTQAIRSTLTESPDTTYTLSEAWKLYHDHKGAALVTWLSKLPDTARLAYEDFSTLYGDAQVHTISRDHCTKFRDLQAAKPIRGLDEYRNWTLEEIHERHKDIPDEDRRKGGRPQEIINQISTFFQWMVDEAMIQRTPAANLKVRQVEGQPTKMWKNDELEKLFSLANLENDSGIASDRSNQQFLPMVMLLLLYTGARLNELCYIRSEDFVIEDPNSEGSIPTIIIRPSEARRIKTPFSIRKVPLHSDLRELGVIDFFSQRSMSGEEYLLDIPTKGDTRGKSVTQRFGRYRDNLGWQAGEGRSLRSFRKTLNTVLTGKSDSDDRYRMMGHSMGTVNDKNYTERLEISLDKIYESLCGATFGLDLDALRVVLERFVPHYPKQK